jgi:hypothetical protein
MCVTSSTLSDQPTFNPWPTGQDSSAWPVGHGLNDVSQRITVAVTIPQSGYTARTTDPGGFVDGIGTTPLLSTSDSART